jgi:hypothetical protein
MAVATCKRLELKTASVALQSTNASMIPSRCTPPPEAIAPNVLRTAATVASRKGRAQKTEVFSLVKPPWQIDAGLCCRNSPSIPLRTDSGCSIGARVLHFIKSYIPSRNGLTITLGVLKKARNGGW